MASHPTQAAPALPPAPALGACADPSAPPQLPPYWEAVALLTPFSMGDLMVGAVVCDSAAGVMLTDVYYLSGGRLTILVGPDGTYVRLGSEWLGPFDIAWRVPATDWLAGRSCECVGTQRILTQECAWWVGLSPCTNGCEQPGCDPGQVGNWLWFRTDNDYPWRMMFIDKTNPYALPVLGDMAFVHFPSFRAVHATDLADRLAEARASAKPSTLSADDVRDLDGMRARLPAGDAAEHLRAVQDLIPGLTRLEGTCAQLPTWPDTMYVTALTVPTKNDQVLPTQIFYDATLDRMLTRLYEPQDTHEDLILTPGQTYDLVYQGGTLQSCSKADPVGPPYRNWPANDKCQCRAAITNNPAFAPDDTIIIFNCPSDPPRNFWIWYTVEGRPVMFSEVPQYCDVGLILIDYYDFVPGARFDPAIFDVPANCGQTAAAPHAGQPAGKLRPLMRRTR